jgi:CubicO group peptidase (beta-lactamase class C family)
VSEPARFSDYGTITSVVVSQGGEVVLEEYLDGDVSTLRNTRSCTKTVAGMLVGMAIDRGIVAGVETSLQELLGEPAPPVKLRDLLTMSSCLDCDDWDDASPGNEELMYPQEDWLGFALRLPLRGSTGFSYCTAGVVALGVALERALGEPLSTFAERELFTPLGIERARWVYTPKGETSMAGGLELTSRSLHRLGELYVGGGEDLIPAKWVAESIRPHARIDDEMEYGYLWWLREYGGESCFFMTGMGGNRVHVLPETRRVAVITTTNFGRRDAHDLSDRLLEEQILPSAR